MSFFETINLIKSDFQRYHTESKLSYLKIFIFMPTIWVLITYRLRRYFKLEFKIPVIKQIMSVIFNFIATILMFMTSIELQPQTKIGKGFYMPHIGSIVLHYDTEFGDYCTVLQGVTTGNAGRGSERGVPAIGSRVYIGTGAVVVGKIKIGNNVAIGANAVVTKDVPDNAVVGGIPAKVINYNGIDGLIFYEETL